MSEMLAALCMEDLGEGHYRAENLSGGQGVVFGGQLLAQSIAVAAKFQPAKTVKTIHTVFARGASPEVPIDMDVDVMHDGRAFGSVTVTIRQGERLCARSLVLLSADEPDLVRHSDAMPLLPGPGRAAGAYHAEGDWQIRNVTALDIADPATVAPPELDVWVRFDGAPTDAVTSQALLAFATDGFLIGAAMLPHEGVGQSLAHVTLSTGVVSHTVTFHESFHAGDWLLLVQRSPYAGHGRTYGRADVFTEDGRLVASFVQDAMVRRIPDGQRPAGK
ncbi:MAG: acyl-CoA thioesterase [Acidimicrobiales bacterium]